jgi:ATP-dependent exoDNAse (exonuclease V) beta subunit
MSNQERLALREASATRRGSLLHAWMKMVAWHEDGPWPEDAWRELAQRDFPQEPDVDNLIAELKQSLDSPAIREGLSRPADGIDLWRERRFVVPSTEGIVSGTFDRVVLRGEAGKVTSVDLIDFKTDRLKDEKGIPIRADHYRAQMVTYRDALASMLGIPQSAIRVELWFMALGVRHAL